MFSIWKHFFPQSWKIAKIWSLLFLYYFVSKRNKSHTSFSFPSYNYWLTKPLLSFHNFISVSQGTNVHYLMKVVLATLAYEFLNLWLNAIKVSYLLTISPLYAVHSFIGTQTRRDCSFIIFGKQLGCFCQFSLWNAKFSSLKSFLWIPSYLENKIQAPSHRSTELLKWTCLLNLFFLVI